MYIYVCKCVASESHQTGKTAAIRRTAVRETGVSRQSRVPNCGHPLQKSILLNSTVLQKAILSLMKLKTDKCSLPVKQL